MLHLLVGALVIGSALAASTPPPPVPSVVDERATGAASDPAYTATGADEVRGRSLAPRLRQDRSVPQSRPIATGQFAMLALTWRGGTQRSFLVRTRSTASGWTPWREAHALGEDGPDAGSAEARGTSVRGTDLLWVGDSDAVQVRAPQGPPRDLAVVVVDPGSRADDHDPRTTTTASPGEAGITMAPYVVPTTAVNRSVVRGRGAPTAVPRPPIRFRHRWGADESLRDGPPVYNTAMKQAHIHHTAGTNDYTRSDVPANIRGMYWYHTQSLGWSDIGYNFLVDRFGRIWTGRAGGPRRNVRGAHTLGFNHQSFGIAALGNFEERGPSSRLVRGISRLAAWKLDRAGRRPAGRIGSTSRGSHTYPKGTKVVLPVIDGHRDTGATACPGEVLYERLPRIRERAQTRVDAYG